ncbi:MAG: ATP synthase F1 subunit delta [Flavobacteriia bacterium]|jgi:F-type H+-transporting ATPase subunit delta
MKGTKSASRYAKALLELAIEQNKLDRITEDMAYVAKVNEEEKDFAVLLSSPVVKADKKITIFNEVFVGFDPLTEQFIDLITRNRRENLLAEIAHSFESQVKQYKGIVPITLISATPLNDKTKETILSKVKGSVKGELEIKELIDESLIGGFIVRMDDKQIDASISRQFNNLKQRLTR